MHYFLIVGFVNDDLWLVTPVFSENVFKCPTLWILLWCWCCCSTWWRRSVVVSALEVIQRIRGYFYNDMRYINLRFTLLTYFTFTLARWLDQRS